MTALVRAELLKLRTTRTTVLLTIGAVAFAAFLGFVSAAVAGGDGNPRLGSADMIERLVGVSAIPAAAAVVVGVLLAAGEFQHGTITGTFLVTPRRTRVVAAKAVAMAAGAVALTVAMVVASVAGAVPRIVADGADVHVDAAGVATTVGGLVAAAALLGAVGVLLGLLVRSQAAALMVVAAWALVLEGIVDVIVGGGLRDWLPGGAASTLVGGGDQGRALAGIVVAGWTAAVAAVATPVVARRDV